LLPFSGTKGTQEAWDHTKKTKQFREQKPEQVADYLSEIAEIPSAQIAYVDETGIDNYLYREYGWSQRGELVMGELSGRKFQRTGIVAAQMDRAIIAPLQYDGTMDSVLFEEWFEKCLLPVLPKNSVIIMDNASFHRKGGLFSLAEKAGCRLLFLPPYSPELNPIENFWSWLKRHLRKIMPVHSSFNDALRSAFQMC
jgi:transposase